MGEAITIYEFLAQKELSINWLCYIADYTNPLVCVFAFKNQYGLNPQHKQQ